MKNDLKKYSAANPHEFTGERSGNGGRAVAKSRRVSKHAKEPRAAGGRGGEVYTRRVALKKEPASRLSHTHTHTRMGPRKKKKIERGEEAGEVGAQRAREAP